MEEREVMWSRASIQARRFLSRWSDRATRSAVDDIVQDTALAFWRYAQPPRPPVPLTPVVQAIARRLRRRVLSAVRRFGCVVAEPDTRDWPAAEAPTPFLVVDGLRVPGDWLLERLDALLAAFDPTNRLVLLAYYEGRCCAEISDGLGMTESAVKVRLYRSRTLLRRRLEEMVRAAGHFEP